MNDVTINWNRSGEAPKRIAMHDGALTVGRSQHCAIRLQGWGIAKEHAIIFQIDHQYYIRDLGALGGVKVNGTRIGEFGPLSPRDRIQIGSYLLQLSAASSKGIPEVSHGGNEGPKDLGLQATGIADHGHIADDKPIHLASKPKETRTERDLTVNAPLRPPSSQIESELLRDAREHRQGEQASDCTFTRAQQLAKQVSWLRAAAFTELDRQGRRAGEHQLSKLEEELRSICLSLLSTEEGRREDLAALTESEKLMLIQATIDECLGLGPIQGLMNDPSISEVMVNGPDAIYIERAGCLYRAHFHFSSEQSLRHVAERIAVQAGRRLDLAAPTLDARLADGSRVNIVLPPLALRGTHITIRKFSQKLKSLSDLVSLGGASPTLASFLAWAVKHRLNLLVAGGTGSGKTTLLNMLAREIDPGHRVITIEDAAELQFDHPHCVSLESRLAGHEGLGAVSIRDLLRNALRMRPDRIVIGECRGGEALDLLQALNTGHGGSMSTIHANSPRDALSRLEVLTLLAGLDLPVEAVRAQIASAFHLVIQTNRFADGQRRISSISEISGLEGGQYRMQDLFCLSMNSLTHAPHYRTSVNTPSCLEASHGSMNIPWIEHFVSNDSRFMGSESLNAVQAGAQLVDQRSNEHAGAQVAASIRDSRIAA